MCILSLSYYESFFPPKSGRVILKSPNISFGFPIKDMLPLKLLQINICLFLVANLRTLECLKNLKISENNLYFHISLVDLENI